VRREALLLLGRVALERGALEGAVSVGERGSSAHPEDPRFPTLLAIAAARQGRDDDVVAHAAEALSRQPGSRRAARRLADALRERPSPTVVAETARRLGPLLAADPSGEAIAVSGLLAEAAGDRELAIDRYRRALDRGASPVPVDRRLRRLLFASGRPREGLALLVDAVPPEARRDERNPLQPAWREIEAAAAGGGEPRSPARSESLARALVAVGALEEASSLLRSLEAPSQAARGLSDRLVSHLAFERAVKEEVEQGYRRKAADGPAGSLAALLDRIATLARRHLPAEEAAAFERPSEGLRSVPFLGSWLDASARTRSPVVAHFRRYGRYLVLGQRAGEAPEGVLLSLASIVPSRDIETQGRRFSHGVAIGYDRDVRSYLDFRGGFLCGACLPDGVWLDADSSRREEHGHRAAVAAIDPLLASRLDAAAADPPRVDGIEGPFALDEPAGLHLRLLRRYLARGGDGWGSFRVLCAHEFGHVLDIDRHLPVVRGLGESAAVLASCGFSLGHVEAFLEGRAQRAAVIDAADADLALADLVRALPLHDRTAGPHERGYEDVVAAMVAHVHAHAARYPAVDPTRKILPQLDRLSLDEIREVARAVAGLR
jgi:hypothetical protein